MKTTSKQQNRTLSFILLFAAVFMSVCSIQIPTVLEAQAEEQDTFMNPKRIVIPKINESIQIDAVFDEPAWKKAVKITPFYLNDGSRAETESTTLLLCYDATALYMAWTCVDSDIQATITQRDGDLWDEEVAEFFLYPGAEIPSRIQYYELQWNPLGTIFDGVITKTLNPDGSTKTHNLDRNWTAEGMQAKVIADGVLSDPSQPDQEWRVEVSLPFAAIGQSAPKTGDVWRGNFYRYNRTTGKAVEHCAWTPTLTSSFHEPTRFGYLEFGGESQAGLDRSMFQDSK